MFMCAGYEDVSVGDSRRGGISGEREKFRYSYQSYGRLMRRL